MGKTDRMVEHARRVAHMAHGKQRDRNGEPHIMHAERVALAVSHDPYLVAIALLHDVVEDTDWTLVMIATQFNERVTMGVFDMTRFPNESWSSYMDRVASNPDAVQVKIADIEDNLSPGRRDAKIDEHGSMYEDALNRLKFISS